MVTMITDEWEGVHSNNRVVEDVPREQLEAAIRHLDGERHTQVVLQQRDHSNLILGGGSGRFNVVVATPDDRFFVLTDPEKPEGTEQLIAGGQLGDYPAKTIVSLESALQAARVYFDLGMPDATQDWIEEWRWFGAEGTTARLDERGCSTRVPAGAAQA